METPTGTSAANPDLDVIRGSSVDILVGQIRGLIETEGLRVGDSLPSERELCLRFGAARNTVREAIRVLKAYGIIEVRPKVGAVVVDKRMDAVVDLFAFNLNLTEDTFRDVQGFRTLVEVGAADELLARARDPDIFALRAINETMRAASTPLQSAALDYEFHQRLVSITGNVTLVYIYKILRPRLIDIMSTGKSTSEGVEAAFVEHVSIAHALERKNRIAYQYHMTRHLESGLYYI
jgi:GntR family transcriptional regulator, transcriptional repressor for pyruvate dehydrogenase complex